MVSEDVFDALKTPGTNFCFKLLSQILNCDGKLVCAAKDRLYLELKCIVEFLDTITVCACERARALHRKFKYEHSLIAMRVLHTSPMLA